MATGDRTTDDVINPLALDGWIEFNRIKWGARTEWVVCSGGRSGLPEVRALLYLDRAGRVFLPPLNPYLAISFTPTPTPKVSRRDRQWLDVAGRLAQEMRRRGIANMPALPPSIVDARPWLWAGFRPVVRYTFRLDLPVELGEADHAVRTGLGKAKKSGYCCDRTVDMDAVMDCLTATETRQGFRHGVSAADLQLARSLLGDEHLRAYVSYAPDGTPACAQVVLYGRGGSALGWIAGGKQEHLRAEANTLLTLHVLGDLTEAGATGFDFLGGNLSHIAWGKANWGARLTPYYRLEPLGLKPLLLWVRDWFRTRGAGTGGESR